MLKFAIVGMGGLGKVHFNNVADLKDRVGDVSLVALCDANIEAFTRNVKTNLGKESAPVDLSKYNLYTDVYEMIEKEELDFIISALPTFLHEKVAVYALEKGIHIFSEKPMALKLEECVNMVNAAKKSGKFLMVGQCLRYRPIYARVKEIVEEERYGKVRSAHFYRLSPLPTWSWNNWLLNKGKSGGSIIDLHVHDVDLINWIFGAPKAVTAIESEYNDFYDCVETIYDYEDSRRITAKAEWGLPEGFNFKQGFRVVLENAVIESEDSDFHIYVYGGEVIHIRFPEKDAYLEEIVDFVNCIKENKKSEINNDETVLQSMKIAFAEQESADEKKKVFIKE